MVCTSGIYFCQIINICEQLAKMVVQSQLFDISYYVLLSKSHGNNIQHLVHVSLEILSFELIMVVQTRFMMLENIAHEALHEA